MVFVCVCACCYSTRGSDSNERMKKIRSWVLSDDDFVQCWEENSENRVIVSMNCVMKLDFASNLQKFGVFRVRFMSASSVSTIPTPNHADILGIDSPWNSIQCFGLLASIGSRSDTTLKSFNVWVFFVIASARSATMKWFPDGHNGH